MKPISKSYSRQFRWLILICGIIMLVVVYFLWNTFQSVPYNLLPLDSAINCCTEIDWNESGDKLAIENGDGLHIWNTNTESMLDDPVTPDSGEIIDFTWAPDAWRIATLSRNRAVSIFDTTSEQLALIQRFSVNAVTSPIELAWLNNDTIAILSSNNDFIMIYDLVRQQILETLPFPYQESSQQLWDIHGSTLVMVNEANLITQSELLALESETLLLSTSELIQHLEYSKDGINLIIVTNNNSIYLWNTVRHVEQHVIDLPATFYDLEWSIDGRFLAVKAACNTASSNSCIFIVDINTRTILQTYPSPRNTVLGSIEWRPNTDNFTFVSSRQEPDLIFGNTSEVLRFYDLSDERLVSSLDFSSAIEQYSWNQMGTLLATSSNGEVRVWDFRNR